MAGNWFAPINKQSNEHTGHVGVWESDGLQRRLLPMEVHGPGAARVCRDPDEDMGWGYGGEGPRRLAASLLSEVAGSPVDGRLAYLYVGDVISRLPKTGGWKITEQQVKAWLAKHRAAADAMPIDIAVEVNNHMRPCPVC